VIAKDECPMRHSFKRYELKYWLPEIEAKRAMIFAQPFMRRDPVNRTVEDGSQRVTSLYLETPALEFYRRHLSSAPDRFKLRIRYYGEAPNGYAYLEVKRKVGVIVDKRRARLPACDVKGLLAREPVSISLVDERQARHTRTFLALMMLHKATPRMLVTCRREAFVPHERSEDARVTIDRAIGFQPVSTISLVGHARLWRAAPASRGGVLLELKYSDLPPWWMRELANRIGRFRIAYSKYVAATELLIGEAEPRIDELRAHA
jgi:hypothetical protein